MENYFPPDHNGNCVVELIDVGAYGLHLGYRLSCGSVEDNTTVYKNWGGRMGYSMSVGEIDPRYDNHEEYGKIGVYVEFADD